MRHFRPLPLLLGGALLLSACARTDVTRAVSGVAAAEAESIRDIMLTVADPQEAVSYFQTAIKENPRKIDDRRGLARSLVRAGRHSEAVLAWKRVGEQPGATHDDAVSLADALVRTSDWEAARAVLDAVPPTHETVDRYKLEAMIADTRRQWDKADSFYETAAGMTLQPAGILNNWGYSKLSRGDAEAAERLFTEAITHEADLFTAKNNLILARAARGIYALPVIALTSEERAQLLHTAGLAAVKRGDVDMGRNLFEESLAAHPRHFEPAARALAGLDA